MAQVPFIGYCQFLYFRSLLEIGEDERFHNEVFKCIESYGGSFRSNLIGRKVLFLSLITSYLISYLTRF